MGQGARSLEKISSGSLTATRFAITIVFAYVERKSGYYSWIKTLKGPRSDNIEALDRGVIVSHLSRSKAKQE